MKALFEGDLLLGGDGQLGEAHRTSRGAVDHPPRVQDHKQNKWTGQSRAVFKVNLSFY